MFVVMYNSLKDSCMCTYFCFSLGILFQFRYFYGIYLDSIFGKKHRKNGLYAFRLCIKNIFWQLIDKLKQTKLYQELKIVINLEKYDLGS